jgi:hypothetical protein
LVLKVKLIIKMYVVTNREHWEVEFSIAMLNLNQISYSSPLIMMLISSRFYRRNPVIVDEECMRFTSLTSTLNVGGIK